MNGRINGGGRACQRPRTSSGAKCFSCVGALAREIAFLNFWQILAIIVALGGASFYSERSPSGARAEERGDKNREGVATGGAT